jgi:hypothetical protein
VASPFVEGEESVSFLSKDLVFAIGAAILAILAITTTTISTTFIIAIIVVPLATTHQEMVVH